MGQPIFESIMLLCFGASWPFAILRTWRAKSAKGKSFIFLGLLILGYTCGMASKLYDPTLSKVFYLYLMNLILVSIDLSLAVRYRMRENTTCGIA